MLKKVMFQKGFKIRLGCHIDFIQIFYHQHMVIIWQPNLEVMHFLYHFFAGTMSDLILIPVDPQLLSLCAF